MTSAAEQLRAEAARRILIKDGAYGTEIQRRRLAEADYRGTLSLDRDQKGNNDLLNLTRPELVREIARSFAEAGADILATDSFNANRISQADYGAEHLVREINVAGARIIREVADEATARDGRRRWVAGAIGPTNKTLSLSPNVNDPGYREVDFDTVSDVYVEQIEALVEGGADFVLIETVFDTLNAKAAIHAAHRVGEALGAGAAGDAVDDDHRFVGAQPFRPFDRVLLGLGAPCPPAHRRAQLLVRRGAAARPYRHPVGNRRHPGHGLSQCRPAERPRRI